MKRIGIISQSPTLKTGFGTTTKIIAEGLVARNFYVACFGIDQIGETFERADYNYKIWTVGQTDLYKSVELFLGIENLDVIIINFDIVNVGRYYHLIQKSGFTKKVIAHLVLDGTPFLYGDLKFLENFFKVIVPTQHTLNYLKQEHNLSNVVYAPHGVDSEYFVPLKNKAVLKENTIFKDKIIIGCFGRNTERKQQPIVLQAVKILREEYNLSDIILYLHCDPIDTLASWNLYDVTKYLNIADIVYFKNADNKKQDYLSAFFPKFSLADKIGICDVCINVPFCGGFELHNIEVQSCGVPLITTNDKGNISEVVKESAILLDAVHTGIWRTGAKQYFVSAREIADKIYELVTDKKLYTQLVEKGLDNVKKYKWEYLNNEVGNSIS